MTEYKLTEQDVKRLQDAVDDYWGHVYHDVEHGDLNSDMYDDITENIVSGIKLCVVNRWLHSIGVPVNYMNPEDNKYPDDEED